MDHKQELEKLYTTGGIGQILRRFAIPSVLAFLIAALYNMVDQIYIGHGIGYLGNSATNVVYPLTVFAVAIALLIGNGCAAYLSLTQGRGEFEKGSRAVGNSVVLLVVSSILLVPLYYFFKMDLLKMFGLTSDNSRYASEYFDYIVFGLPFYMFGNGINAVVRADGSPRFSMIAMSVGCVLNIILDPIAIFVLGWGMKGAAIATVAGQIVTAMMMLWYLFRTKTFRLSRDSFRMEGKLSVQVCTFGLSSFITQITLVIVMAVMNSVLVHYGALSSYGSDIPLTVLGIVLKVFSILTAFCTGIAVGVQPAAGFNQGAGNYPRVRELLKSLLIVEGVIGGIALIIFEVFPLQIVSIFGSGDELYMEFALYSMRIYLCGCVLMCLQKSCCFFLQALGKPFLSSAMSVLRELALHVPLMLLLPLRYGVLGVLFTAPISDLISCAVCLVLTIHTIKGQTEISRELKPIAGEAI